MHLRTTGLGSEAIHEALDEFYKAIPEHGDQLAETGTARHGREVLEIPVATFLPSGNPIAMLKAFRSWIDDNRGECSEYSDIQNQIDEVLTQINSTLYKLERLM
jgi:hypothetical protein